MLFRDRPLNPDQLDASIYVEREELENELVAPLLQGRNVLLLGSAGSGKTTLMRRAARRVEVDGTRVVWVNAALARSAEELLAMVAVGFGQEEAEAASSGPTRNSRLLALTRGIAAHPPGVIVVDGLDEAESAFDLFGRLRDELWAAGHAWLVSTRPEDAAPLRTPPAEAFWGAVVEIPPLSLFEIQEFIARGLEPNEHLDLANGLPLAGQTPRILIRALEAALASSDETDTPIQTLIDRASDLGRSEGMAMVELIGLGRPASVWDPELTERLGWSRAYAQRVFAHLELEGLVRSFPERRGEQGGRPRKVYEPNPRALA
jgi:predicted transcriptional regulator